MSVSPPPWRRSTRRLAVAAALALLCVWLQPAPSALATADVGTVGPTYTGASAPTGQKPQSKLWFADGQWWGCLFDQQSGDFHIFRFVWAADEWVDTGVLVDERASAFTDALWDGQHLYIASAGMNAANNAHSPRITRFSYDPATTRWTRDPGYPVTVANGGVEAVVLDKDSTGMLWMTFTQGSKVWLTHSTPGDDRTWVPKFQLPAAGGESNVDPDDISAVVAYDGDKIGVLWSNQRTEKMYWASHDDGTSDQSWSIQVAYDRPEGADDHINLKSLVGDDAGRVFAVAKTSLNKATDPLIHVLVLSQAGDWSSHVFGTVADNHTRAIVEIDPEHRDLYVFAAHPCCAGGDIYYKKTSLDSPQFEPGLGTVFMHSDAHPELNNPTSTKQTVSSRTGLLVLAGDDQTHSYMFNKLDLGSVPPQDTTPPETTIDSGPPSTTTDTQATFAFSASEPGSTFLCSLDGQPDESCVSPATYSALAPGTHTFSVRAVDAAGNVDTTPAELTWTIEQSSTLFADDFSSGGFASGGWVVNTGTTGTATVVDGAVRPGDLGARLQATTATGSTASIQKTLSASQPSLSVSFDARVDGDRSGQVFTLLKLYDEGGQRVLSLTRSADTAALSVTDLASTSPAGQVPLGQVIRVTVHVLQNAAGPDELSVSLDGTTVFTTTAADLGARQLRRFRLGDDSLRRQLDYRVDNVVVGR